MDPNKPISSKTRVELFENFTSPHGPALMLSDHYYLTGRSQNSQDPVLTDPLERLKWNQSNLPYFSVVAKRLRVLRNGLVHHGNVNVGHLQKLEKALVGLSGTSSNFLVKVLIEKVVSAISIENYLEQFEIAENPISLVMKEVPKEMFNATFVDSQGYVRPLYNDLRLDMVKADPELKQWIKGRSVTMLFGKYYGLTGIFRSWSGTVCYIDFPEVGKKTIKVYDGSWVMVSQL